MLRVDPDFSDFYYFNTVEVAKFLKFNKVVPTWTKVPNIRSTCHCQSSFKVNIQYKLRLAYQKEKETTNIRNSCI